uniref:Uncharacterized protein n=1 Tax=Meloidogyne incognita TaxID=6306 RepID=A0A914MX18_MELIC
MYLRRRECGMSSRPSRPFVLQLFPALLEEHQDVNSILVSLDDVGHMLNENF